jgi:hypothetical protein
MDFEKCWFNAGSTTIFFHLLLTCQKEIAAREKRKEEEERQRERERDLKEEEIKKKKKN